MAPASASGNFCSPLVSPAKSCDDKKAWASAEKVPREHQPPGYIASHTHTDEPNDATGLPNPV